MALAQNPDVPTVVQCQAQKKYQKSKAFSEMICDMQGMRGGRAPAGSQPSDTDQALDDAVNAPPPTKKSFNFRIYSMGGHWPDVSHKYAALDSAKDQDQSKGAGKGYKLPGMLVQDETQIYDVDSQNASTLDQGRSKCFEGFQATWELFNYYGRDSLDGNGMRMVGIIHMGSGHDNAQWNQDMMFFGDGGLKSCEILRDWASGTNLTQDQQDAVDEAKKELSSPFCTYDLNFIGHELTHGVVQNTAALGQNQTAGTLPAIEAGTLDEHVADVFGMLTRQFKNKETVRQSSWDVVPNW